MGDYMAQVRAIMADDFDREIRGGKDDAIFAQINRTTEERAQKRMEEERKPMKRYGAKRTISWVIRYFACLCCLPCFADFAARNEILLSIMAAAAFFGAFVSLVMDTEKGGKK